MPYPLRFQPILRRYLWGGRKLERLSKALGKGDDFAESWEICDHGDDQSVVLAGEWQGHTLGELIRANGRELLGRHHPQSRFPLLFKFLDANRRLSVQVHPDDAEAARLDPPDLGKTEAWVVLEAEPGSRLYAGLKRGFDRAALEREVRRGTCELCLHTIEPAPGDCVFIPAGMVHAIGEGLLIAEIQQASDTTFRLFDWNRTGPDGQPRQLHIEQALEAIDFRLGPGTIQTPHETTDPGRTRLVACDKFVLDRLHTTEPATIGGDDRFHILAVLGGEVHLDGDPIDEPLTRGGTALIPAAAGALEIRPQGECVTLDAYLP